MSDSLQPHGLQHARLSRLHHLLELAQTHVYWVSDAIQPSHPLSSPSPAFNLSIIRIFSNKLALTSGGQSVRTSALVSVLLVNIQDWFPLGLTGLISLQSKGLSLSNESSSTPQFKSINSLAFSLICGPLLVHLHDYWQNHSFDYMNLCWQSNVSAL